jgi:Lon protease-like protein
MSCIPEPHVRTRISYPATENRTRGFHCPFPDCEKEHAVGDCSPNVALGKVIPAVRTEFQKGRAAALNTSLSTHLVAKDGWEASGVPTLRDPDAEAQILPGGRLLATYLLADMGYLDYNTEVTYLSSDSPDHAELDARILAQVKEVTRAEMDCQVCYALYYDSVTTHCGHTFCRVCLQRVLDHARHCPVCRRPLTIQPITYRETVPENELITRITTYFWADMLKDRRDHILSEVLGTQSDEYDMPLFICTLSFPLMPTFLHVFEPRYRLMIRRALAGNRSFGMVLHSYLELNELGTVLRIENFEFFPDGRILIETRGVSRLRIVRHGQLDGYTVAKTEPINDISISAEEELEEQETRDYVHPAEGEGPRFPTTAEEIEMTPTQILMDFATDFVKRMQQQGAQWLFMAGVRTILPYSRGGLQILSRSGRRRSIDCLAPRASGSG